LSPKLFICLTGDIGSLNLARATVNQERR